MFPWSRVHWTPISVAVLLRLQEGTERRESGQGLRRRILHRGGSEALILCERGLWCWWLLPFVVKPPLGVIAKVNGP